MFIFLKQESSEEEYDASEYPQRVGRQKHVLDINIHFNDARRGGNTRGRGGGRGGKGGARNNRDGRNGGGERQGGGNNRYRNNDEQVI